MADIVSTASVLMSGVHATGATSGMSSMASVLGGSCFNCAVHVATGRTANTVCLPLPTTSSPPSTFAMCVAAGIMSGAFVVAPLSTALVVLPAVCTAELLEVEADCGSAEVVSLTGVLIRETTMKAHSCEGSFSSSCGSFTATTMTSGHMVTVGMAGVGGSGDTVTCHGH